MAYANLEERLNAAGDVVNMLRNAQAGDRKSVV